MYQAPSTTPPTEATAIVRYEVRHSNPTPLQARWNDPKSTMNSPTKPFSPGSPMLEKVKRRNMNASHGARAAIPPRFAIERVW